MTISNAFYGLPLFHELNNCRENCCKYYMDSDQDIPERVANWFIHRCLTVVAIPANALGVALGGIGMAISGIYAVALTGYEIAFGETDYPTGFRASAQVCVGSCWQLIENIGEIAVEYLTRFAMSYEAVVSPSNAWPASRGSLPGARQLNIARHQLRVKIDRDVQDLAYADSRTGQALTILGKKVQHALLSVVVIPANVLAATLSFGWAVASTALVVSKVALYTLTGIAIQQSTGHERACNAFKASTLALIYNVYHITKDTATAVGDIAVVLHVDGAWRRLRDAFVNFIPYFCRVLTRA